MSDKFRAYDSKLLTDTFNDLSAMQTKIESLAKDSEADISALPPSVIPSELLYRVIITYSVMYDALLKTHITKAGGVSRASNYLH